VADDDDQVPTTPDARTPNMARMYDYALGGKDNYAVDRAAIEKLFQMSPENRDVPRANRRFLDRAVRFVAGQGIRQFLDLGAGFPSQGNVHEVAGRASQDAHVVYIDDDPVVVNHARALLATDHSTTAVVQSDLRDTGKIFTDPDVVRLIDFSQPVAILFVSVLHGIPDKDDPWGIVGALARRMVPGSYLIVSHLTRDGHPADVVRQKEKVFAESDTPFVYRSRADILRFFDGFELAEPGLTPVTTWRGDEVDEKMTAAGQWWLGGVARKI
jgi:S-adenosyl methyltransferase